MFKNVILGVHIFQKFIYSSFMYLSVLPAFTWMHTTCVLGAQGGQKRVLNPLGLEL